MTRLGVRLGALALALLTAASARADGPPPAQAARDYLASVQSSAELQAFLDRTMRELLAADPALRRAGVRVAVLDLSGDGPPRLAHHHGETPVYPASVVKFVYLMATYAWVDQGRLAIDPWLDGQLTQMIHVSSNDATQRVFARLTGTQPGPTLPPEAYRTYRERRLAVERWLHTLGITDLHCVNPTYNGNGDLAGRDEQFLRDRTVEGGLPSRDGEYPNRQAMTAVGTVKLLALLATDRALSPAGSAAARERMRRDPDQQPYLARRIAGVRRHAPELEVFSKSGTWGPIYADAGIVRHPSGREVVLAAFTDARPSYRGDFIAALARRTADHLLLRSEP
jgi:beta-lactamase class A